MVEMWFEWGKTKACEKDVCLGHNQGISSEEGAWDWRRAYTLRILAKKRGYVGNLSIRICNKDGGQKGWGNILSVGGGGRIIHTRYDRLGAGDRDWGDWGDWGDWS